VSVVAHDRQDHRAPPFAAGAAICAGETCSPYGF
jgi:hypothetical protein